jgi:hypothetical protein
MWNLQMQAVNNIFKWSFYTVTFAGLLIIGGVFGFWLSIETVIFLMGVGA